MIRSHSRRFDPLAATLAVALYACAAAPAEQPVGTAFTYQGEVRQNDAPIDQNTDFQFRLWDDPVAGNELGVMQAFNNHPVADGRFTVQLDFGSQFSGDARFLEIAVRSPAGVGGFTTLSPRQPLTPAPYALYALNAAGASDFWTFSGANLTNTDCDFVGIHRNTRVTAAEYFGVHAPVESGYGGMYIRTDGADGWPFYGYRAGTRSAWHYLDGQTGRWHLNNSGIRVTVDNAGRVGVGTNDPQHRLDVHSATGRAISAVTTSGSGATYGVYAQSDSTAGVGVLGLANAVSGATVGVRGRTISRDGGAIGVHGIAEGSNSQGTTYGVKGESWATAGVGVWGDAFTGVRAEGRQTGIHATATNPGGLGVRGEGDLGVHGRGNNGGVGVIGEAGNANATGMYAIGGGGLMAALRATNPGATGIEVEAGAERGVLTRGSYFALGAVTDNEDGVAATLSNTTGEMALAVFGTTIMSTVSPLPDIPDGVLLAVDGKIMAEELEVQLSEDWPDYVFADDYALKPLAEVEQFVREHRHLPDVPSAADVATDGINVGAMQATLLRKVEELTLHVIALDKKLAGAELENQQLRTRLASIEARP